MEPKHISFDQVEPRKETPTTTANRKQRRAQERANKKKEKRGYAKK